MNGTPPPCGAPQARPALSPKQAARHVSNLIAYEGKVFLAREALKACGEQAARLASQVYLTTRRERAAKAISSRRFFSPSFLSML